MKYNSIGEQLIAKAKELDPSYKPDKFNDMSEAIDILLNNSGGESSRVFEPTINSVSISNDDTYKQLTFDFSVSNFEIITYLTTLIENDKPFTETLYLKTPANNSFQMMFNTPLSLVNSSSNVGDILHCFNLLTSTGTDLKCDVSYGENNMILDIFLSDEDNYTVFKQLMSPLFTKDTKIKITVKTDE